VMSILYAWIALTIGTWVVIWRESKNVMHVDSTYESGGDFQRLQARRFGARYAKWDHPNQWKVEV